MQAEINFDDNLNTPSVHPNSVAIYNNKIKKELMGRRLEVYQALTKLGGEGTLSEIGSILNRPLNTFSGRIKELRLMNLLEDTGRFKIHGNSKFTIWKTL